MSLIDDLDRHLLSWNYRGECHITVGEAAPCDGPPYSDCCWGSYEDEYSQRHVCPVCRGSGQKWVSRVVRVPQFDSKEPVPENWKYTP